MLSVESFNIASILFIKILMGLLQVPPINTFGVWLIGLTLSVTEYYTVDQGCMYASSSVLVTSHTFPKKTFSLNFRALEIIYSNYVLWRI